MADSHSHHHHSHHHGHERPSYGTAFLIGVLLNVGFVAVEAGYGFFANSLALMADAGHNLSDVLGLLIAWAAIGLSRRKPSSRFTYGLGSSSILAALANAMILLIAVAAIAWDAVERLRSPQPVAGWTLIVVAGIGIVVNASTAALFASGRKGDLNIRSVFYHMLADALISVGVVMAGALILWTDRLWIDPVISLIIALVIVYGTWELLRDSLSLAVAAVPSGINADEVMTYLNGRPGVCAVHDLHIWAMSTTETALTAHLVIPNGHPGDGFFHELSHELEERFSIHHATVQIEMGDEDHPCHLESDEVV